jgi:hypothetical protein
VIPFLGYKVNVCIRFQAADAILIKFARNPIRNTDSIRPVFPPIIIYSLETHDLPCGPALADPCISGPRLYQALYARWQSVLPSKNGQKDYSLQKPEGDEV